MVVRLRLGRSAAAPAAAAAALTLSLGVAGSSVMDTTEEAKAEENATGKGRGPPLSTVDLVDRGELSKFPSGQGEEKGG